MTTPEAKRTLDNTGGRKAERNRYRQWATALGVTKSRRSHVCLCNLYGKGCCQYGIAVTGRGSYDVSERPEHCLRLCPPAAGREWDHATLWNSHGRAAVAVNEPYADLDRAIKIAQAFAGRAPRGELAVLAAGPNSPHALYNPGNCAAIISVNLTAPDALRIVDRLLEFGPARPVN